MSQPLRIVLICVLAPSLWACHTKKATQPPKPAKVSGTTKKVPGTLTPQQHINALNAQLHTNAVQTRGVEGLSAEGTIFSHFSTSTTTSKATPSTSVVDKVVIERKGETFDETISIYYKNAQPKWLHQLRHVNPAKMMNPGDEGYNEAIKSTSTETNTWQFREGKLLSMAKKGDTTQLALERRMADHAQWSLRMMRIQTGKACRWQCTGEGDLCGQIICKRPETP